MHLAAGHTQEITAMAWSPDGRTLATGSADHTVILWDAATWRPRATLPGLTQDVIGLSWRPDSTRLAANQDRTRVMLLGPDGRGIGKTTLGNDSMAMVWDVTSRRQPLRLDEKFGYTKSIVWARDGRAVIALADRGVSVWDAATGRRRVAIDLTIHAWDQYSAAVSPDGGVLGTAGTARGGSIDFWATGSGRPIARAGGGIGPTTMLAWSPSGATLASVTGGDLVLWNPADHAPRARISGPVWTGAEDPVAWSPDGQLVAAYTDTSQTAVAVWDAATGRRLVRIPAPLPEESKRPLEWCPRGRVLAFAAGAQVVLWDAATNKRRATLASFGYTLDWSPDGRTLAIDDGPTRISLWDPFTGQRRAQFERPQTVYQSSAWSPDGKWLATLSRLPSEATIWDAHTGAPHALLASNLAPISSGCVRFGPDGRSVAIGVGNRFGYLTSLAEHGVAAGLWTAPDGEQRRALSDLSGLLVRVAWNPSGATVALATEMVRYGGPARPWVALQGGGVTLWDAPGGGSRVVPGKALQLAWAPTGRLLATALSGGRVALSDAATGKRRAVLNTVGEVHSLCWSPDGRLLATNGALANGATVLLWDARSGRLVHTLLQRAGSNYLPAEALSLAWSPDSKRLATGLTGDTNVKVWNASSGVQLATFRAPLGGVNAQAWSPDGRTLAAACTDNKIILWDTVSGGLRAVLRGHTGAVTALDWSPGGSVLASGSADGTVRLWVSATLAPLAMFHPLDAGKEWVTTTPEGYYEASPGAERFIQWSWRGRLWPASKFRRRFERPDLVRKALAALPVPSGGRRR